MLIYIRVHAYLHTNITVFFYYYFSLLRLWTIKREKNINNNDVAVKWRRAAALLVYWIELSKKFHSIAISCRHCCCAVVPLYVANCGRLWWVFIMSEFIVVFLFCFCFSFPFYFFSTSSSAAYFTQFHYAHEESHTYVRIYTIFSSFISFYILYFILFLVWRSTFFFLVCSNFHHAQTKSCTYIPIHRVYVLWVEP